MKKRIHTYLPSLFIVVTLLIGPSVHAAGSLINANGTININSGGGGNYGASNGNYFTGTGVNSAASCPPAGGPTLCSVINTVVIYLNQFLILLIGLSVVVFVYYVFKYFIKSNENRTEGATYVMYSLIGFFVILSMWGLVNILQNTFGLGNSTYAPKSWSDMSNIFPK